MSYDIAIWRGAPSLPLAEIWARLQRDEAVPELSGFAADEVRRTFQRVFGPARIAIGEGELRGPGFELRFDDGARLLYITCAWSLGEQALTQLREVARQLDAVYVDLQTLEAPPDRRPPVEADLAQRGAVQVVELASDDDRARSFARVETWRGERAGDPIHALYLEHVGDGISPRHPLHPRNLVPTCDYVRLLQSVLPFEIIVGCGRSRAADGSGCGFPNRVLGVFERRVGFVELGKKPVREVAGRPTELVSEVALSSTGPGGARLDLTQGVARAVHDAMALARTGETRRLRDWIVFMVALAVDGHAVEELADLPVEGEWARGFELFDAGAVMPLWTPRALAEARLSLPDDDRFALKIIWRGRDDAAPRHDLPPPLGPAA